MSVGHDEDNGVTYFQATTNRGTTFERGFLKGTDKLDVEHFTIDAPLVGLIGYESGVINGLGFIRYQCPPIEDE